MHDTNLDFPTAINSSGIQFSDGTFQGTAAVSFDQSLNTTDTPTFQSLSLPYGIYGTLYYDQAGGYQVRATYESADTQLQVTSDGFTTYSALTGTGIRFPDGSFQTTAASSGNFLPLSGGTMTGGIYFGTGGQNINVGSFDNGYGGSNGISLYCSVGYELNWQAGRLKAVDSFGSPVQINVDSQLWFSDAGNSSNSWVNANDFAFQNGYGSGKSLYWDGMGNLHIYNNNTSITDGVAVSSTGITFPDGSYQTTAAAISPVPYVDGAKENAIPLVFNAGTRLWTDTTQNGGILRVASDFVNDSYISLQSNSGVTAIQVADGIAQKVLSLFANGIQFSDGTLQTTAATTPDLSGYLLKTDAATTYYPLSSNPAGYLTSASLSGYATQSWVTSQGYETATHASSTYLAKANNLSELTATASTARTNLGLGTAAVANFGDFIQSPAVAATDGQIPIWDAATSRSIWQDNNARTLFATVRNASGALMPKGSIVYITGGTGNHAIVSLAKANSEATSSRTFGILSADLPNNTDGQAIVTGYLSGVDTSLWVEGTQLYLSPTVAGGWTSTKPSAPNHLVYVAKVTRQQSQQGTVEVGIQNGYEVEELHNAAISSVADKDLFVYESATSLWKNKSFSTLDLLTATAAAGIYQTQAGMSSYLTASAASSTYETQTHAASTYYLATNPNNYITSSALSPYLLSSTATSTYFAKPTGTTSQYLRGDGTTSTFSTDALSATSGTYLAKASNLSDLANTATARTNLGLGTMAVETASNYAKFSTSGTFTASQVIEVTDNTNAALRVTQLGTGESFRVEDSTNPDSTPFVIDNSGNVGIGVSAPVYKLDVGANAQINSTSGTATLLVKNSGTGGAAYFSNTTSSTGTCFLISNAGSGASLRVEDTANPDPTPFIVDASGNVGVKTATPSTDFEVAGNGKFTTANITSPPAAGDSSTLVPTTAWVQSEVPSASTSTAGKVQLATNAEAIAGTDTTKAVTAAGVATEAARKFARRRFQTPINLLSTQVNGTGAGYTQVQQYCNITGGNVGVAGFARGYEIVTHPDYGAGFDWARSIGFGAFFVVSNNSAYAGTYVRCGIGYTSSPTAGVEVTNFTARGIGFYWAQGGNLFLHVHDGTTLRSIDTGYAPTTTANLQRVYAEAFSDGAGNVTAYVRVTNSQATGATISEYTATSANGPTGALAASPNNGYLFQVVTGTTHTSVLNVGSLHPTFFCD